MKASLLRSRTCTMPFAPTCTRTPTHPHIHPTHLMAAAALRHTCAQVAAANGEVIITNDGATILNKMTVAHPAAKMLVELAKSQVSQ